MKTIYTITVNPAIDYVITTKTTPDTKGINRNETEEYQFGGKGINVSNMVRTLGGDTVALGFVAGFTGEGLEKGLRQMGLRTDFVHLQEGMTRINVKVRATSDNSEMAINGIGPRIGEKDLDALYQKISMIDKDDILVLSGAVSPGLPRDIYSRIMNRLKDKNVRIVVDTTGEALLDTLKYKPFLIKQNHIELAELGCGDDVIEAAGILQKKGALNVLVSMAEKGAILLDENKKLHTVKAPCGNVINSVGAGDSMVASFLYGYEQTSDYNFALKMGVAAGSATAFCAGLATREHVQRLFDEL